MVYLDTNVFVYPVIYEESASRKAEKAKEILLKVATKEMEGFTATLTWDEITWVTKKLLGDKDAEEQGKKFLTFPNLNLVTIDSWVIMNAQKIMQDHSLNPRDAIHASAALVSGQRTIISDDQDFDRVKGLKRTQI
ncbi:MAG: type II toxin-antitoxin system VapC family toxin [Nitrososphaerales archaeon]